LQLFDYFIHNGSLEKVRGSNLNKSYPVHVVNDDPVRKLESTYAMGEEPELTVRDLIKLL
jgi:hypothetical protein